MPVPDGITHERATDAGEDDPASTRRLEVAVGLDEFATWLIRSRSRREMSLTTVSTLGSLRRDGPMRLTELAEREGVAQPSMTALITRLEQAGLAVRRKDTADKRGVNVEITEEGRAVLARRHAQRAAAVAELLGELGPEDEATLAAALPVLRKLTGGSLPTPGSAEAEITRSGTTRSGTTRSEEAPRS
jgi:DNA-binding MarR family transcriptional regulator